MHNEAVCAVLSSGTLDLLSFYLFTFNQLFYLFTFNQLFYLFTLLLLTSFFTFLLFYSFTFKSESSFHHNQVFFPSQPSLLFIATKSSFLKEYAYFSDYGCTSRSTPKVHPKYTMSIVLILIVLSVISSKKVYLCTFFEKSFQ